ncbi:MAG: hypothetical protein H5T66_11050, partial [Chloroflexi bacterium]|nr:hypothetical protein [Chloroflexota bacterium]
MPVRPSTFEEPISPGTERPRKGPFDENDDSLLLLRGGVRGKRFAGLRVEVRPVLFGLVVSI